jgi:hypothetical protein
MERLEQIKTKIRRFGNSGSDQTPQNGYFVGEL